MLEYNGNEYRYYIPKKVMDLFNDEFDYCKTANQQELTNLAVVLFIGIAGGPATTPPSGAVVPRSTTTGRAAAPKPLSRNSANNLNIDYADKLKMKKPDRQCSNKFGIALAYSYL